MRTKEGTQFESRPTIAIDSVSYEYVVIQRGGLSAIYRTPTTFLRIGSSEKIRKDLVAHKQMEAQGFPVAKLIAEGSHEGMEYFIEESLGESHFGNIFKQEIEARGVVSDETFETFISISEKWAEAQLGVALPTKHWDELESGIHLDTICEEMPEEREQILAAYEKVKARLVAFPFTLTHGDFGPFNMYPKGVIDLESSFMAPAPYDVGAVATHLDWLPDSHEYEAFQLYRFTPEQKKKYLDRMDAVYLRHGLPKVSDYLSELDFLKGIWFVVKLDSTPKLQQFRFNKMRELLKSINNN